MSGPAPAAMISTIPRPRTANSPSPTAPPTGPLPALPMAKTRRSQPEMPDEPFAHPPPPQESRPSSAASVRTIPTPTTPGRNGVRSVSGLPTPKPSKSRTAPAVPTLSTLDVDSSSDPASALTPPLSNSTIPPPGKTVRKTSSYGAFPLPPQVATRVSSLPPSPLSAAASLTEMNAQKRGAGAAKRSSKPRSSGYGSRLRTSTSSVQSLGGSPSLLNGTGENKLISGVEGTKSTDSLLGLPSPPQSRSSSADGSFLAGDPAVEDGTDGPGESRGRPKSQESLAANKRHSGPKDAGKGNVLVSVRVRPDAASEGNQPDGEWMVDGRRSLISYKGREAGDFRYDNVFSPHDNNSRVYDNAAKRLVRRVMEGYHGTVFAYGMTGTGKTFSMQGTASSPGVIPLAITDIFSYIRENPNREFLLRVSYLEIYNEKIYDLLNQGPGAQQQEEIKLREDAKRGVYATPLKEEIVQSPNQLLRVIARGDMARRTGSTQFNQRSSRSHAVVQIVVESRARTPNHGAYFEKENRRNDKIMPGGVLVSTLSLIDLAGSERAAENKERRTEGAHINKSLLTLGTVIARLSGEDEKDKEEGGAKSGDKEKGLKHLPYRDSKLTRLLQPALSGNSLVSILCTVQLGVVGSSASASTHTGETLNTLKFASRAKNNIVSHAKRNISTANANDPGSRALLDRYRMEIQELRAQLETQNKSKDEVEKHEEEDSDRKIEEDLEKAEQVRHEEQMLEMQLARTALKERISHLNRLILSSKSLGVNSGRMSSLSSQTMPNGGRSSLSTSGDYGRPVSVRSRDSIADSTIRDSTVAPSIQESQLGGDESAVLDEEEDSRLEEGDASQTQQIRMLQADLSDKNRYIATLEKRLLQARRTSHSRVSMQLASRGTGEGGMESLLRDKDREIDELKAKLDDQVRMVNALRSAARKRETLEFRRSNMSDDTARPSTALSSHSGFGGIGGMSRMSSRASARSLRLTNTSHSSNPSRSSGGFQKTPLSPMALLSPTHSDKSDGPKLGDESKSARDSLNRRRSVDEMTMLLDQMIQEKVESGHVVHGDRGSLRIKRDTVMEKVDESVEGGEKVTNMHKTTTSNGILTTPIEPIEEMSGGEQDQGNVK